ncbi:MAG: HPr(Ser) kinase/phosphatase [Oscillospiraceae bacterium]|jgi:HPr kinase/phosphorylase|nr:HPr(Ser) kinase/phosphatase [Oscillospiraceae bacterium]
MMEGMPLSRSIKLGRIIKQMNVSCFWCWNDSYKEIEIESQHINRLGLDIISSMSEFDPKCVLVMGESEHVFTSSLESLGLFRLEKVLESVFSYKPPVLFVTRGIIPSDKIVGLSKKNGVPIFSSSEATSRFVSDLSSLLDESLAKRITRSAGCISIHGEGVLVTGESGVGKSEVELELVRRGHKFVSDDVTEIRRNSLNNLLGASPGNISRYMEIRGIGIIDVQQLFGANSIKSSEKIEMIINLEDWKTQKKYERLGDGEVYAEIMGVDIPYVNIPIRPGKNLAVVIEVAVMNNRLRKMGLGPFRRFADGMGQNLEVKKTKRVKCIWEI